MAIKTDALTQAVTDMTTAITTVVAALDDLAARLAAASANTGDPAAQQAIDTAVANLAGLKGNLLAAVGKDDPAPTPAP